MIIRLISLIIRGIISANTSTKITEGYQSPGFHRYKKDFFDREYQIYFYKWPIGSLPTDIEDYKKRIGHITLMRRQSPTRFEIYETNVISENELAMNVKLSYSDFVMTGISSRKNTVVTKNEFFILFINYKTNQLEIRSSIYYNTQDKLIKSDFGEYLIKYLIKDTENVVV